MAKFLASLVFLFAFFSIQGLFCLLWAGWESVNKMPLQKISSAGKEELGIMWAVMLACSSGYINYRYQVLKKDGFKEENIIVFMYNDSMNNMLNQSPDIIINHLMGQDIYVDVPQDYTGNQVTTENLYAVLLGNKSAVCGGSGKVVDSKPNDQIFVYYSNHGGMSNLPYLFSDDFISLLQKKHESKGYKEMVIYDEACKKGRIFEGVIPQDLNIHVITASNAEESNWGTYCPRMDPSPPFQVSSNLKLKTIGKQYQMVKEKTSNSNTYALASENNLPQTTMVDSMVKQTDVEPLFLWRLFKSLNDSKKKTKILKLIKGTTRHHLHVDNSIDFIGKFIFGYFEGPSILQSVRSSDQPIINDWDCYESMMRIFVTYCGSLSFYEMRYPAAFANICNKGVSMKTMQTACIYACAGYYNENWSADHL